MKTWQWSSLPRLFLDLFPPRLLPLFPFRLPRAFLFPFLWRELLSLPFQTVFPRRPENSTHRCRTPPCRLQKHVWENGKIPDRPTHSLPAGSRSHQVDSGRAQTFRLVLLPFDSIVFRSQSHHPALCLLQTIVWPCASGPQFHHGTRPFADSKGGRHRMRLCSGPCLQVSQGRWVPSATYLEGGHLFLFGSTLQFPILVGGPSLQWGCFLLLESCSPYSHLYLPSEAFRYDGRS